MTKEPDAIRERGLSVHRTARYHTLGPHDGGAEELWVLLHGYGELARGFLAGCAVLDDGRRLLVAPEGLSRFYRQGSDGAIGASWMTREARETEIADYVAFLDELHAHLVSSLAPTDAPLTVLGFSQGAATAARWAALGSVKPQHLVLWAGGVPPDLDLAALHGPELSFVVGERDRWITPERVVQEEARLSEAGVSFRTLRFDGGHRLDDATLGELAGDRPRS